MQVYRCYSNNLKGYLMDNGLKYLVVAKDIVTDKTFWLFEKTDRFEKLMQEWMDNSPNK